MKTKGLTKRSNSSRKTHRPTQLPPPKIFKINSTHPAYTVLWYPFIASQGHGDRDLKRGNEGGGCLSIKRVKKSFGEVVNNSVGVKI